MNVDILGVILISYSLYLLGYYMFKAFDIKEGWCMFWPVMISLMFIYTVLIIIPFEGMKHIAKFLTGAEK